MEPPRVLPIALSKGKKQKQVDGFEVELKQLELASNGSKSAMRTITRRDVVPLPNMGKKPWKASISEDRKLLLTTD